MDVSVAMATYMGAAHVLEQLTSIVEQSTPPAEIIVCDDRSEDETVRLVAGFAASSSVPIRLLRNEERLGWRENSLKAASLCTSDVIAFCDQDDVWDPRKLALLVAEFERTDALMVFHDAVVVGPDLAPIEPFLQGGGEPELASAMRRGPWRDVYGFTVAFRRELLALFDHWPASADKSVNGQRAAHDQWVLFLAASLGTTVHLPQPLALYRQHAGNAVGVKDAFRRRSRIDDFLTYRDVVNLRLVALESRVRVLRAISRLGGDFGPAAASALVEYERYRDRIASQTVVYSSGDLLRRLRALVALLARGAYSSDVWALGRLQVLDDAVATLIGPVGVARLARLVARRGRPRQSQSPK